MKKISRYLPSLILSVLLVFSILGSAGMIMADVNLTAEKVVELAEKNNIYSAIYNELDKYFSKQYNTTGIPKEVYMNEIDERYIKSVSDTYTEFLFDTLYYGSPQITFDDAFYRNEALENSITAFFSDYADSNGYEKDDVYKTKLNATIDNAYGVICDYCDIYKYSALNNHGVLGKISVISRHMKLITAVCIGAVLFILLLLFLVNRREKLAFLYWTGISALVAGLLGTAPCIYLLSVKYFDAFTIKQPQVYTSFTESMYGLTRAFMAASIAVAAIGVSFVVLYGVLNRLLSKKAEKQ